MRANHLYEGLTKSLRRVRIAVIRAVATLLQSPKELSRPAATRRKLVGTLFGRASNLFMVAVAATLCGAATFARGGNWMLGAIAAFEVSLLLARCLVIVWYNRCEKAGRVSDADAWLAGFGLLALTSSMSWGALCFIALATEHDPLLYIIPTWTTIGVAGVVAARNSGVPRLAKAQIALSLAPICAGCFLLDDHGFRLLVMLVPALVVGLLIFIAERNQQLVDFIETQAELARLSQTDALTQLPNRRSLDIAIEAAASGDFALLMIDVDHYKTFNDRYGHLVGDAMLRTIAIVLQQNLRGDADIVARYGGEEFAVLLRDTDAVDAARTGERLRQAVQHACRDPQGAPVTISIGCAMRLRRDPAVVMREADEALYKAKSAGRNRVEIAQPKSAARDAA